MGSIKYQGVDLKQPFGQTSWNGVSYQCPHCHAVLGVQIDPIAVKTDIVNELFDRLKKGR